MHNFLITLAILLSGIALRSFSHVASRKLGAVCYLASFGTAVYFVSSSWILGMLASVFWVFLPCIELATRIRALRMPINNKLRFCQVPCLSQFPDSDETISRLEIEGFEHTSDAHWSWGDSTYSYSFFWHPEHKVIASVCFCEQKQVTFSFLTLSSQDANGNIWKSTNYPFSQNLISPSNIHWNTISCKTKCLASMCHSHSSFITKTGTQLSTLSTPDPETIETSLELETKKQIDYNITKGIIRQFPDNTFGYSLKGLFYLWAQALKDMVKLF